MWEPSWSWSRRLLNHWLNWFPVRQRAAHLIRHDHDLAVAEAAQRLRVVVALLVLQADYFDDVVDLCVLHDLRSDSSSLGSSSSLPDWGGSTHLLVRGLADVEDLPSERENSVAVPPDDAEPRHGQRLGRVSLGEDQCALGGVSPPWGGQRSSSHFSTFRRSCSVVTAAAEGGASDGSSSVLRTQAQLYLKEETVNLAPSGGQAGNCCFIFTIFLMEVPPPPSPALPSRPAGTLTHLHRWRRPAWGCL